MSLYDKLYFLLGLGAGMSITGAVWMVCNAVCP
jgi:hypothetical protein